MYGGTKTEMERLIKDANDLRKAQGLNSDLTIESYADVIEAIHTVQENMGITGTTAKEAEHTIQGSLNSTKAAWQNLLTSLGSGKDVKKAIGNLTKSAKNVVKNVVPIVENALGGIGELVSELGPVIVEELPGIVEDLLPTLLSAIGALIGSVARALPGLLSALWRGAMSALDSFGAWLAEQSPVLGSLFDGLSSVIERISEDIEALVSGEKNVGEIIIGWFTDAKTEIEKIEWDKVGKWVIDTLAVGLQGDENTPSIVSGALSVVTAFIDNIRSFASTLVLAASALIAGLADGIGRVLPTLIPAAVDAVLEIIDALVSSSDEDANLEGGKNLGTAAKAILTGLADGIKKSIDIIGEKGPEIVQKLIDKIGEMSESIISAGKQIIEWLAQGFVDAFPDWNLNVEAVKETITGLLGAFVAFKAMMAVIKFVSFIQEIGTTFFTLITSINPVIAIIFAAAAALVYFWNTSNEFRSNVKLIFGEIGDAVIKVFNDIKQAIENVREAFQTFIDLVTGNKDIMENYNKNIPDNVDSEGKIGKSEYNPNYSGYGDPFGALPTDGLNYTGGGRKKAQKKHASAMLNGEILRGITPFGFDQAGNVHYGGDAGAEAVVGVSSLRQMVQEAAMNAVRHINVQLILDNGVLVAEMAPLMDEQLNDLATWRGGGRA